MSRQACSAWAILEACFHSSLCPRYSWRAGENSGKTVVSAELASLQAKLQELAKSGNAQGDMLIALAGESTEHHSTAMRLQRKLAQECQAMGQRQERLAAELAAAQRSVLELRSGMPAAPHAVSCCFSPGTECTATWRFAACLKSACSRADSALEKHACPSHHYASVVRRW